MKSARCVSSRVTIVMVAFDGGFLDGPVHALDLAVGPGMLDLGEPMLDAIFPTAHMLRHVSCRRAVP